MPYLPESFARHLLSSDAVVDQSLIPHRVQSGFKSLGAKLVRLRDSNRRQTWEMVFQRSVETTAWPRAIKLLYFTVSKMFTLENKTMMTSRKSCTDSVGSDSTLWALADVATCNLSAPKSNKHAPTPSAQAVMLEDQWTQHFLCSASADGSTRLLKSCIICMNLTVGPNGRVYRPYVSC